MSQKYDFHGVPFDDAMDKINEVVGNIRMSGNAEIVEFVTGHGVIKFAARELIHNYGIDIFSPLTSPSIIVTIE